MTIESNLTPYQEGFNAAIAVALEIIKQSETKQTMIYLLIDQIKEPFKFDRKPKHTTISKEDYDYQMNRKLGCER